MTAWVAWVCWHLFIAFVIVVALYGIVVGLVGPAIDVAWKVPA